MKAGSKEIAGAVLVLMLGLLILGTGHITVPSHVDSIVTFNAALWDYRGFDILGQAMLLIAGAIGVVLLLREESHRD